MDYDIRERLSLELNPATQAVRIKTFISKHFGYDARPITNSQSLLALLLWLLDKAEKHIRQEFVDEFDIRSVRVCDCCGKWITSGYMVNGFMSFCSDKCLFKHISPDEYNTLCDRDEAYWTAWDNSPVLRNWCCV